MSDPLAQMITTACALNPANWTICILAGGKSQRMGRDKSRIVVDGTTLLARTRATAASTGADVLTIRTDALPNCGPLSGILTGLKRARSIWCVFLGCDMPLVSRSTLLQIMRDTETRDVAMFTESDHGRGFPLTVATSMSPVIQHLIENGGRSLAQLADALDAAPFTLPPDRQFELFNANTPGELAELRRMIRHHEA